MKKKKIVTWLGVEQLKSSEILSHAAPSTLGFNNVYWDCSLVSTRISWDFWIQNSYHLTLKKRRFLIEFPFRYKCYLPKTLTPLKDHIWYLLRLAYKLIQSRKKIVLIKSIKFHEKLDSFKFHFDIYTHQLQITSHLHKRDP